MRKRQFCVLYREFLFRLVDFELLSADAHGDTNRLLGQLAAILGLFSVGLGMEGLMFGGRGISPTELQAGIWRMEHFLILTTMLVVGLFAVLCWDSTFPSLRDLLVIGPLPVRAGTMLLAKISAVATGLALAVSILNVGPGLSWPLALSGPDLSVTDVALPFAHRSFFAYWGTMFAAGTFLFSCVLSVQGFIALLPRAIFLRVSSHLQLIAFCLFLSVYFLEPSLTTPSALAALENRRLLAVLPSYWFLGLFQQLNGTLTPETTILAQRAWIGLATALTLTGIAYLVSWVRVPAKVAEEPDIAPQVHWPNSPPQCGTSLQTAILLFTIRTLARSRQHRIIFAFYAGVGFAIAITLANRIALQREFHSPFPVQLLFSSLAVVFFPIAGTRILFTIPLDVLSNWIFRLATNGRPAEWLSAVRRSLYLLAALPAGLVSAVWLFWVWPWALAARHLLLLTLFSVIVIEVCLYGFNKIPFTCSWLPGKSGVHLVLAGAIVAAPILVIQGVKFELLALEDAARYSKVLAILAALAIIARWCTAQSLKEAPAAEFDQTQPRQFIFLGLYRD